MALLQADRLGDDELQIEPGCLAAILRGGFQECRGTRILIAELHAILPVGAFWRRSHTPFRRTIRIHHRNAGLHHVGGEGGIPEHLLGDAALGRHRTGFAEGHALRLWRGVFLQPFDVFGDRVDSGRAIRVTAAFNRRADRTATFHADAPFVDRQTIRNALVAIAGH